MRKAVYCLMILLLVVGFAGCKKEIKQEGSQTTVGESEAMADTTKSKAAVDTAEKIVREKDPVVVIETGFGNIEIELFWKETPKTALNFLRLVHKGFYDGLTFHRIVPNFVIQGGDPEGTGEGGPGYTIPFEKANTKHLRGSVGMARAQDLDSGGSQFYICLKDLPSLDGRYVVFGKVIKGMDAVDKIAQVKTTGPPTDRPLEKVVMKKVYELKPEPKK
ncbi:MAG TPA: peptidylprolyl isomerase [Terriglobales bacterium]|nr:peptidylprolyl isomerase [Terriglobales bacterium]